MTPLIALALALAACPPSGDVPVSPGSRTPDAVIMNGPLPTDRVYVPGGGFTEITRIDESDPRFQAYRAQQKLRVQAEQDMKRIRNKHFGDMRKTEIRQAGIAQLEKYYDNPAYYPALIEIYSREKADVRTAILDAFAARKTEQGDAAIAWVAVQDRDPAIREEAVTRMVRRAEAIKGDLPNSVKTVIASALQGTKREAAANAAHLADALTLIEAIPTMILAQAGLGGGGGTGVGSGHGSDIAWIMVGRQQAYVADLTPVVGNSAVGFDPEMAVLTEGTVLRIGAAYATLGSNGGVNGPLVNMTKRVSGFDTASLGYSPQAWARWYNDEFIPLLAKKQQEQEAAEKARRQIPAAPAQSPQAAAPRPLIRV